MKVVSTLLILLTLICCNDDDSNKACTLSSISYNFDNNPNLKVTIDLKRNNQGFISQIKSEGQTYTISYINGKASSIKFQSTGEGISDVDYIFLHFKNQDSVDISVIDFPNGEFDSKIILIKNESGEITEKTIFNSSEEITWSEKYNWENGNIVQREVYYKNDLTQTVFYSYDNHINPLIEIGHLFSKPELTTKNNVLLTSSENTPISNYNYSYNSKGLPINYQLPVELGDSFFGQLNYSSCD